MRLVAAHMLSLLLFLTWSSAQAQEDPPAPGKTPAKSEATDSPASAQKKGPSQTDDPDTIVINARVKQWVAFVVAVKPIEYTPLGVLPKSFRDKIVESARDEALEGAGTKEGEKNQPSGE